MSLKALALLALERNRTRNLVATAPEILRNSEATASPQKVAPSAERIGALLEALEDLTTGSWITAREAFEALAPEDRDGWESGEVTRDHLQAFVSALETVAMREKGTRPPHYCHPAHCARCGPVWLWEAAHMLGCPWCGNRLAGLPIPRPEPVTCRNCRHYIPDPVNPPGGRGGCELRHEFTWPGGDCRKFEARRLEF